MRNIIIALLIIPLLAILQSTLLPYFNFQSAVSLDLVLVIVLSWNLVYPNSESMFWALLGGLMLDALSGAHMGTNIIALTMASLIPNLVSSRIWSTHILLRIFVGITGTAIYYIVYFILLTTTGWQTKWSNLPTDKLVNSIMINVFVMILILPSVRWIALRITKRNIDI
ncbi:MAG: rod shape-determining protein MreD [Anaerolineaceae bacterium]|nr:rod shape-determining protein MreD [Anaerolineaceae bacterium]